MLKLHINNYTMTIPCVAHAAQAAGAAGSAGAAALGLGLGKTDLDLTRELFKMQMRQAKRLWTADWAENSVRHGEQCMQSAQQHAEAQAMAAAAYFQAEKLASQGIKLARDQDSRAYEITWRAEVRESLRDELANQNNRFNTVLLCDSVCLGCAFSLVADGSPPVETPVILLNAYIFSLGLSITLFSISLWCSVIVVRRLHEHTASILERKLFAQSEDLQKTWAHQLAKNLPTGPHEMYLVNQAYEKWVAAYLGPIGKCSIHMMSIGVVTLFITAGLLMHNRYLIDYPNAISAVAIFWFTVFVTSVTVLYMKFSEDLSEKRKEGIYDSSWYDKQSSVETGPFAKISRAAEELFSAAAVELSSQQRMDSLVNRERMERDCCVDTIPLQERVHSLREESEQRAATRRDVLKLLTTATEEMDALPEDLTARLNKMLHDIDEADRRTADNLVVTTQPQQKSPSCSGNCSGNDTEPMHFGPCTTNNGRLRKPPRRTMPSQPIEAQGIPVSLGSLRKKLGEVPLTTLLKIKNLSEEPLRLKSGVQLKGGKYIKSLSLNQMGHTVTYHLYPGTEIPPRTEILVAARSSGGWIPTSGIDGTIIYTNRDESWMFRISFCNELFRNKRKCIVKASSVATSSSHKKKVTGDDDSAEENINTPTASRYWEISKDEFDRKANNEIAISIDLLQGEEATKAAFNYHQSLLAIKSGFLLKNNAVGMGLQWQRLWFELTPTQIVYQDMESSKKRHRIAIKDVTSARRGFDMVKNNVFEIHTNIEGSRPYKLAAASQMERDDWIFKILGAAGIIEVTGDVEEETSLVPSEDDFDDASPLEDSIECVPNGSGVEVLSSEKWA